MNSKEISSVLGIEPLGHSVAMDSIVIKFLEGLHDCDARQIISLRLTIREANERLNNSVI